MICAMVLPRIQEAVDVLMTNAPWRTAVLLTFCRVGYSGKQHVLVAVVNNMCWLQW